jgi:hypothetical protein
MIKNEFIKIKVSSGLKQNYSGLGYDFSKHEIDFRVSDLKDVSNQKIEVICDICGVEYNIHYCKYIKNIKRNGFYSCKFCGHKRKSEIMTNNNISLNPNVQIKKKETFLKNYGVDNPSKSESIKKKKEETCLKNYGVTSGLKLRDKVKQGMLDRFGVEFPLQSERIKEKMCNNLLIKYGVDNVSRLLEIKNKKEETCLKNYGVRNPGQSESILKKQLLSAYKIVYYNDELFAQGTYELDFLNWCEGNKIINLISNGPTIKYILNGVDHYYHADFFIESLNLIIEIKSTYTYNFHYEKNIAKSVYSKSAGYNFIFVIDKQYDELLNILKNNFQK